MSEFVPTPHPVLMLPTKEQAELLGEAKIREILQMREEVIRREKNDPFRYGYELPFWKKIDEHMEELRRKMPTSVLEEVSLGGNRASKSERAAKRVMQTLVNKPNSRAWCLHSTQAASRQSQMPLLWKYLPAEWRPEETGKLRKGVKTKITYSQSGGFTEDTFVLPNGSQCWFKFYSADVKTVEGVELDVAWADELITLDWVEAVRFRLMTRGGLFMITFTPLQGYSATVSEYLTGAATLESSEAKLLAKPDKDGTAMGYHEVPRVQQCRRANAKVFYFHTEENPWQNKEALENMLVGASREKILCRAYGVPTKVIGTRFPKFSDQVHVIARERVPTKGTRYQVVDPCSGRNWFMLWAIFDDADRCYIYREFPSQDTYIEGVGFPGEWAEPGASEGSKIDGKVGSAQQSFGWGLERYKQEIARLENGEEVFERWMDSRYGNTATVAKENATTLIEECADIGLSFLAAPGQNIDEGIELINDWLAYDDYKPISAVNAPRLYISSECKNLIYALKTWTGMDGNKGATKDPIDCLRYLVLSGAANVEGEKLTMTAGGCY